MAIAELMGAGGRYGAGEATVAGELAGLGFDACSQDPIGRAFTPAGGVHSNNKIFFRGKADLLPIVAAASRRRLYGVNF